MPSGRSRSISNYQRVYFTHNYWKWVLHFKCITWYKNATNILFRLYVWTCSLYCRDLRFRNYIECSECNICSPIWPLSQRLEGNLCDSFPPVRFHIAQTLKMASMVFNWLKENLFLTQAIRFRANINTDLEVFTEGFITDNAMIQTLYCQGKLTSLSPYRQVFILLDIQHQLQAVAHPTLHRHQQGSSILARIEGVTFSITCEYLKYTNKKGFYYVLATTGDLRENELPASLLIPKENLSFQVCLFNL